MGPVGLLKSGEGGARVGSWGEEVDVGACVTVHDTHVPLITLRY